MLDFELSSFNNYEKKNLFFLDIVVYTLIPALKR